MLTRFSCPSASLPKSPCRHAHTAAVVDRLLRRLAPDARVLELPPNIEEDVEHVGRTLASLQDVLVSLEIRTEAQEWTGKIKQITYDMEDLLDEFDDLSGIGSQRSGSWIAKAAPFCWSCPFLQHSTMANRIKTIKRGLDISATDSVIFSLTQHPWADLEHFDNGVFDGSVIVGRDNDQTKIKDMLLQSNSEELPVIPIVGLVGLGKTTLARLIFYDQGEGWNFDLRIWICLNRKFDLKKVASDIILQCNHKEEKLLDAHADTEIQDNLQLLKNRLQEVLHEKSCLIVLDDLSSTDKSQLDELKEMLKGANECTKVLVTTSSEITAELVHTVPPYKLRPLSEDDSWTIFSQKAFGNGDSINAHIIEIGKQIVKRCEGIPLLTHSLGSFVKNQVANVWLAARDEEIWKLERRLATKMEVFSSFYQIYYDLPSTIKLCFMYLSIFPKGSAIDKEKLIRQWIALDMIGSRHDSLPPYVHGEMCIQDLLSMYFLQVPTMHTIEGMNNRIAPTALYMHNFVHEFASHVACDDTIILDGSKMQKSNAKRQIFQYALLTYYRGQSTLSNSLLNRARALHLRNSGTIMFHSEAFELLKHLRVLNLSGCCFGELPASVGHLKHLRYLDVSGVQIQTLPSPMSRLTNLETLDLSKTSLKELPSFIGNFLKLKYLNMQGCDKLQNLPSALGHLQRLEHLRLSCCNDVRELPDSMCNLHDLRFLDLSRCTELQHLPPLFGNLTNLEDLSLSSCFNLKQLPESFGNLYFLRFLNLSSCYELQQLPESLTNLDYLEVLILRRCCKLQNLPRSLATIKYLRVLDLAGCEELHVSTGILTTNLEYLNLQRCRKLQTQPYCFENFNKLKFLNLSQCLPTIDCLKSVGYLFNLEYLNLPELFFNIPVSFTRLQKLHTLDLTGCPPIHQSSSVHQILLDIIGKMTALRFVLTKDPVLVASLPRHVQCSVSIDEHWHRTTDELVITDIKGGSRGSSIAERLNLQNRLELHFLKLEWIRASHSDEDELVDDVNEVEVLEKLQPNQSLEHFELVKYAGYAFPTWMMNNMITSLPYLVSLCLFHLQNCNDLPPLGQLRNLRNLHIKDMPNLRNLEIGLSGGPQPFKKLTHLKLETLINLKELSILFLTDTENQQFMFPTLEELSVLSCSKLIFKPSLPRCKRYEVRESNNVLSSGQPLGPPSAPSPAKIEISGCLVPSSCLQWLKSLQTVKKVVIDACVGDDGEALTSFELPDIKGTQESSSTKIVQETTNESSSGTNISHELTTQDGAHKVTGSGSSIIRKLFPRFNTASAHSVDPISSFEVSTPSKETPSTSCKLSRSKMLAELPGVGSLSLKQVMKATRKFSPSFKLGEGGFWTVYKAILPDNQIVTVRRAKKGHAQDAKNLMKVDLAKINHWSLVRFLGFIDKGNEFIMITEYVPNGTIREHLTDQHVRTLDFSQRIVIAIDVAIALTYLHLAAGETAICCNLKTTNILLTESYRAKVCSCDLSGCGRVDPVRGTPGYIDPEWLLTFELTAKSDVYSFGIVLLEIVSSHKPFDQTGNSQMYPIEDWALEKFNQGQVKEILDYRLKDDVDQKVLRDWLSLALRCAAPSGNDRPSIEEVGEKLWKIWKDHRLRIGKPFEYERSWAEFIKEEGILMPEESMCEGSLDTEFPTEGWTTKHQGLPECTSSQQIGFTQEAYTSPGDKHWRSPSASFDIIVSPR
ncbi:probable disease resistance protein RF9 [Phragmites australis]|uniref:probable disease resistance protein RF9 n=1 Tax=Phragmites australis TaxID=29695 RepID=UPI002D7828AE|nr:probable disease resistance protein RF9 [Phragmites australis]